MTTMPTQTEKCEAFARLHSAPGIFLIPNPWDVGSALVLQNLGFPALATTSAGFAQTMGKSDGAPTLTEKLAHCTAMASKTRVPINVDFEDGYAVAPEDVAANVVRLAETGVAGCSIEDFDRNAQQVFDASLATERVAAAAEAVKSLGMPFQLTARAENLLRGINDLDATIVRLKAYEQAGADVLYAPGLTRIEDVKTVVGELANPVNILAPFFRGVSVADFRDAGVKRLSVGSALASLSLAPVIEAGKEMLADGTFTWTGRMPRNLNELLKL